MIVFTVHEPPNAALDRIERAEQVEFVRDGFQWLAAVIPPLWMLINRLWIVLIVYLLISMGASLALTSLGVSKQLVGLINLAANIIIGFEADSLKRWTLGRRGWAEVGTVAGKNREECERRFFDGWLIGQPMLRSSVPTPDATRTNPSAPPSPAVMSGDEHAPSAPYAVAASDTPLTWLKRVVIIDYGSGNLHSAAKAFERAAREAEMDASVSVTSLADDVAHADRIVLPGVGAFADCAAGLDAVDGMRDALESAVIKSRTAVPRYLRWNAVDGDARPRVRGKRPASAGLPATYVQSSPLIPPSRCRIWAGTPFALIGLTRFSTGSRPVIMACTPTSSILIIWPRETRLLSSPQPITAVA